MDRRSRYFFLHWDAPLVRNFWRRLVVTSVTAVCKLKDLWFAHLNSGILSLYLRISNELGIVNS